MPLDFPSNPVDGQVYDNYYYDAAMGTWRGYGIVTPVTPPGIISQYAGSTAPSGYLMCDGQSLTTAAYPALFQAIGYQYGGSGANFNVPNLQNRVPVGKGTETEFDTLGETGGAKTHTLTTNEMPSHLHATDAHAHTFSGTTSTNGSHSHTTASRAYGYETFSWEGYGVGSRSSGQNIVYPPTNSAGDHTHTYSGTTSNASPNTQNTGGGLAHNNLQPYIVLNYIIKT